MLRIHWPCAMLPTKTVPIRVRQAMEPERDCQPYLRWCCSHGKKPLASASSSCGVALPAACTQLASSSAASSGICNFICVLDDSVSTLDIALYQHGMTGAHARLPHSRSSACEVMPRVIYADSALDFRDSIKLTR